MQQIVIANRRVRRMSAQAKTLQLLSRLVKSSVVALLLGSVVFGLFGCQTNPSVPQVSVYRPPADLMRPAPTQYLLAPEQQRKIP